MQIFRELKRLFSYQALERELLRERAENARLLEEHVRALRNLESKHVNEIVEMEKVFAVASKTQEARALWLEGQVRDLNDERKRLQDNFLRLCGVNPIYQEPPGEELRHYENQPDDSGLTGARILSRSQKEQEEFQRQDEIAFRKWENEKLGMTSE